MATGSEIKLKQLGDLATLEDGTDYKAELLGARVTLGFAFTVTPKDAADSGNRQYGENVKLTAEDLATLSKSAQDELKALAESKLNG